MVISRSLLLSGTLIIFFWESCTKSQLPEPDVYHIRSGAFFKLDIFPESYPVENRITIIQEPKHAKTSMVSGGVYHYQSIDDFEGKEKILIQVESSQGDYRFMQDRLLHLQLVIN